MLPMLLISTALAVAVVAVFLLFRRRRSSFVIGAEMASATEREKRRLDSHPSALSPLPNVRYDFWRGELDLTNPTESSVDRDLRQFLLQFVDNDEVTRNSIRGAISLEEFYELIHFSKRAAVFGLQSRNQEKVGLGLAAIAVIDVNRTDFRDVLGALSLLHHAAERTGVDVEFSFQSAARLATRDTAELILGFLRRPPEDKDIRTAWGYDEVITKAGVGFIEWGFKRYHPTYDLKGLALEIGQLLAADLYQPDSVQIATDLPAVWLPGRDDHQRQVRNIALQSIRAGVSVSGKLRPQHHPRHDAQTITAFVVECPDRETCSLLLDMTAQVDLQYAHLASTDRDLFSLLVARSFVQGVESYETTEALERLAGPLSRTLRRTEKYA